MAYGNSKNLQRRAVPAGKTALGATDLPSGKLDDLKYREGYLAAANSFVDVVFTGEPLTGTLSNNDMHDILLAKQQEISGLNKAYVEKARLSVPNAIRQVEKIYLNRPYGRLLYCASPTGETDPAKRLYLNIPLELQDKVTSRQHWSRSARRWTVIAKPEEPVPGLDGITHLIGQDFGMVNTVSLSVVEIDKEISQENRSVILESFHQER